MYMYPASQWVKNGRSDTLLLLFTLQSLTRTHWVSFGSGKRYVTIDTSRLVYGLNVPCTTINLGFFSVIFTVQYILWYDLYHIV